ncbi:RagB/SusD family nutrient uptake outer membrane protein [Flavobacteriaceae bacterium MHTCC 0001]
MIMKKITFLNNIKEKSIIFFLALAILNSCSADFDRDYEYERHSSDSQKADLAASGNTLGLQAQDGAILAYFRDGIDGPGSTDEFGIKAIDLGMDLRSNDMDMSRNTWFGAYSTYDNVITNSNDNDFIWEFLYKVIGNANGIINSIPDESPQEVLVFKNKSYLYRGIAYFYLLRIYQHTTASDATEAVPIDFGDFGSGNPKSTVGQVKERILEDLTWAYDGLKDYSRASKEEVDGSIAAAYLARFHLTYENWSQAEKFADIAMQVGSISEDVSHGFDELSLSEAMWGSIVTDATTEIYASFFSHMSQINDGYSGWNHFKTVNSNLYNMIPATDKRLAWFADQDYDADVILVPGTWGHYNITPKYTSLKFISAGGPGVFVGDYIYLRNTEFYLTKAEALARQGNDPDAQQVLYDLNSVRDESYTKSTNTGQALIDEILMYRRIELWGDGVASFDMARLGVGLDRQDGRENPIIPGGEIKIPALDPKMIFDIPQAETESNPAIN